jgi:hypothetical protein
MTVSRAINPKLEIRNPKQIQNPKKKTPNKDSTPPGFGFGILNFGFVSDFVLRISDVRSPDG